MTLTMFCFYPIQQSSIHDTYNVLFLNNSSLTIMTLTMFCFYPIQQTSNHDTYNVLFLYNRLPIMTLTMFCFYTIQQSSKHWTPKQHTQPKAEKCPSSASHFSLFNQDRHCNTHRNGNCPDNTTHLAVHLDCDLCRHRHQLFCFIQCARNHHLRRYCKTNQTNHAVKMTIKTIINWGKFVFNLL